MWLPSIFSSTNKSQTDVTRRDKSLVEIAQRSYDNFLHQPQGVQGLSYIALGSLLTYATMRLHRRYRRFKNSDWITPDVFAKKRWIKGKVTKWDWPTGHEICVEETDNQRPPSWRVGDADNFRLYHTPGPGWRFPLKLRSVPTTGLFPIALFM